MITSKVRLGAAAAVTAAVLTASGAAATGTASAAGDHNVKASSCAPGGGNARNAGAGFRPRDTSAGSLESVPTPQERSALIARVQSRAAVSKSARLPAVITVPVAVHIIKGTWKIDRPVTNYQVKRQIAHLNKAYAGNETKNSAAKTRFKFTVTSTDRITNNAWYHQNSNSAAATKAMKNALHVGGPETLNIYFVTFNDGLLGFATFPYEYAAHPALDGVVIDGRTVPGGAMKRYNQGDTATHEIGHWLGLLHVFDDNGTRCVDNDGIRDTPIQKTPSYGCPTGKNSCPNKPGVDNIHNYMDYSYDWCMYRFTKGQAAWMVQSWAAYRAPSM